MSHIISNANHKLPEPSDVFFLFKKSLIYLTASKATK